MMRKRWPVTGMIEKPCSFGSCASVEASTSNGLSSCPQASPALGYSCVLPDVGRHNDVLYRGVSGTPPDRNYDFLDTRGELVVARSDLLLAHRARRPRRKSLRGHPLDGAALAHHGALYGSLLGMTSGVRVQFRIRGGVESGLHDLIPHPLYV